MSEENKIRYAKYVSFLRNTKKKYYGNLDKKKFIHNKRFWKTIKPLLLDILVSRDQINLIEKKERVKSKSETVEILNKFFSNIVKYLDTAQKMKFSIKDFFRK